MIELNAESREAVADLLNKFPEVRWDRMTGMSARFFVYGWLPERPDGRTDFIIVIFEGYDDISGCSYQWVTSSAEWSREFASRFQYVNADPEDVHVPCQRVEDVLGGVVNNAIALETTDPMRAGGDVAGPEDPHGHDTAVVDLNRAVMTDGIGVVILDLEGGGEPAGREVAFGLFLEGDINKSDPREHAKVLNLMGVAEAAGTICELQAAAHRFGGGLADELVSQLKKRWAALEQEGLTEEGQP